MTVERLLVALLKVLQAADHPERLQWIADYKAIDTGIDGAIFMAEARLKLRHGMDIKKLSREIWHETRRTTRQLRQ